MYLRASTRRRLRHFGLVLLALVLFTPRLDLPAMPQLTALFSAAGLGQPQAG